MVFIPDRPAHKPQNNDRDVGDDGEPASLDELFSYFIYRFGDLSGDPVPDECVARIAYWLSHNMPIQVKDALRWYNAIHS